MPLENEPTNFDEANQAVMNMFEGEPQDQIPIGNAQEQPQDVPPDTNQDLPPEQAEMPPPQTPQQPPPSPEVIIQQAFGEIQALRQQNQQLQQAMQQMNDAQKQNVVEEALTMPTLDLSTIAFDDENTLREKQANYTQKMAEYMKATMMRELSPFVQQAQEGMAQKEKANVLASLSAIPELQGIDSMLPQLDQLMANNKLFASSDVPLDEKYITAYLLANALNGRSKKTDEMTPEKFMQYYQSNAELKDLIDKQRLDEIKGAQDVPQFSASNGAVNAALTIPNKPTSFDEANELVKKSFFN